MAKEYIEREALIAEISAAMKHGGMGDILWQTLRRYVMRQPTADVVEVVRCGECKSWCPISNGKAGTCKGKVQGVTKPNDFCSRGERRDNNAAD